MKGPVQLRRYTSVAAAASSTIGLAGQPFWVQMPGGEFRLYRHDGSSAVSALYASTDYLVPFDEMQTALDLKVDIANIDTDPTLASPNNTNVPSTLAIKTLIDDRIAGVDWKDAVVVRTTANITLSGTQTIDGVGVVADDRVLVMDQTDQTENGLYLCKAGAWVRTADADDGLKLAWATVTVIYGTVYGGTRWNCNTEPITIGVTNITWTAFGGGTYTADGSTIELIGSQFRLKDAGTTNAKLADMAEERIKGRAVAAGTGAPTDLTPDQVAAILDEATDPPQRSSKELRVSISSTFTTSSASTVDVTGAAITLAANKRYKVDIDGAYQSDHTSTGIGISISRTGSPTVCNFERRLYTAPGTSVGNGAVGTADDVGVGASATTDTADAYRNFSIRGTVVTGVDPCTIQVRTQRGGAANDVRIHSCTLVAHEMP